MKKATCIPFGFIWIVSFTFQLHAEDGYRLWLRYDRIENDDLRTYYQKQLESVWLLDTSATGKVIHDELVRGLEGLLGTTVHWENKLGDRQLVIGTRGQWPAFLAPSLLKELEALPREGFILRTMVVRDHPVILLVGASPAGTLYGVFHFLQMVQMHQSLEGVDHQEAPRLQIRMLDHWDNLDRTVERGYAGFSIWDWHRLPDYLDPRYLDYARANASIGINGTVLTNVNANHLILRSDYLDKVKALADLFRPYGIKVYLTARFSAPVELGHLPTADPLDPRVRQWWRDKAAEIYARIPDFGGFLVKANSEGQPGPQNYHRSHADGANVLADAVQPFGGIVIWRAFVYSDKSPEDRAKQAYQEFVPLDGQFRHNVLVQVKNGPIDFQPREPFHPMFGAMHKTPLMMEFQITQEYLGQGTHLVYLGSLWEEVLQADTYASGPGTTVARTLEQGPDPYLTGMAGVANIGTDRNWTGHLFGQANWYAFGRLSWNPEQSAASIAEDWIRLTFSNQPVVRKTVREMMMNSWETCVNYMTPLGLAHLMATGHHYGPGPWVNDLSRPEWNPVYYHRADAGGIGFDRTATGSNAIGQYAQTVQDSFGSPEKCPEQYLLWFHHVAWQTTMKSGFTLWESLCQHYDAGVAGVRHMITAWESIRSDIDPERYDQVRMMLTIQQREALWWRDASIAYWQSVNGLNLPPGTDPPRHNLDYYQSLSFPFAPGIKP